MGYKAEVDKAITIEIELNGGCEPTDEYPMITEEQLENYISRMKVLQLRALVEGSSAVEHLIDALMQETVKHVWTRDSMMHFATSIKSSGSSLQLEEMF